jgi:hypothetical protein
MTEHYLAGIFQQFHKMDLVPHYGGNTGTHTISILLEEHWVV